MAHNIEEKIKSSSVFEKELIVLWTHELIDGIEHLHSMKIIHRDIKPK